MCSVNLVITIPKKEYEKRAMGSETRREALGRRMELKITRRSFVVGTITLKQDEIDKAEYGERLIVV